ncbi:hypothetical protein EGW08_002078 [Elysia chlorotica]|uniref:Ubiquitin-like domain-containing protein n=1 Tax=Elysia chlorotica TaxID=188477 RepID=A0A433U8R8_ELYCH|nr:hypothetical protein EGW08_002078 [Elysia chlorotica]
MAFVATQFEDDGLPHLGAIDQLDQLWKRGVASAGNPSEASAQTCVNEESQSSGSSMAEQNAANNGGVPPQAVDLEATPDLELKIRIVYADSRVKNMEGSLNPTRTVQQLKARLATQLNMQPHLMDMHWSKQLTDGKLTEPRQLDNNRNLMHYEVETDDTIILTQLAGN